MDSLSRLFEMMSVRRGIDSRCSYGARWRIEQGPGEASTTRPSVARHGWKTWLAVSRCS
jgi:hypothetical protein